MVNQGGRRNVLDLALDAVEKLSLAELYALRDAIGRDDLWPGLHTYCRNSPNDIETRDGRRWVVDGEPMAEWNP